MGAAVFGALLGPVVGAIASVAGVRATFIGISLLGFGLATWVAATPGVAAHPQPLSMLVRRADRRLVGGMWLLVEPPVRRAELAREALPRLRLHRFVLPLVDPRVGVEPVRCGAEEGQHPRVRALGLGPEVLARDDEQLLGREHREPALELLRVAPAGLVGMTPPGAAEVARVGDEPLLLSVQPLLLGVEGILERERLTAERDLVVVVRERPVDRVADQRHQARLRHERPHALGAEGMEDVARARLADELAAAANEVREVAAVPPLTTVVVAGGEEDIFLR